LILRSGVMPILRDKKVVGDVCAFSCASSLANQE
jgi:hypothetical protein